MSKSELANAMGISPSTMQRFLRNHEAGILELDPMYNKSKSLLSPKVIGYLIKEFGFSWEEILSFNPKDSQKQLN